MGIVAGDGGVDLHRHAEILQIVETGDGGIECAWDPAECIVSKRVSAVQANRNPADSAIDDLLRNLPGNQRAIRGQRDAQALVCAVARQLKNVLAEERLATAQHKDGRRNCGNLIDDVARGFSREIVR